MQVGAAAVGARFLGACGGDATTEPTGFTRFTARPGTPTITPSLGLTPLGLGSGRDGIMYVPASYTPATPAPMLILLHGAGGSGPVSWTNYYPKAEARGMILLAPSSRSSTWDFILGNVGPDVKFIDSALAHVFARCRIDASRISLTGFSDGAGYAVALGQGNGDVVSHVMAHSPGFYAEPDVAVGKPRFFVSHGTGDTVLSFSNSANLVVPQLVQRGYAVTFMPFDGGHELPDAVAEASFDWFLAR